MEQFDFSNACHMSIQVDIKLLTGFHLILKSSFDIVPHWLLQKLQRTPAGCLQTNARRVALQIASQPVQWMLDEQGVSAVAKARMLG